jgi:hypothetical protein
LLHFGGRIKALQMCVEAVLTSVDVFARGAFVTDSNDRKFTEVTYGTMVDSTFLKN